MDQRNVDVDMLNAVKSEHRVLYRHADADQN